MTWHFVTIAFLVLGVALTASGFAPDAATTPGVAYVAGSAFACWAVFSLTYGFRRGGHRALTSHRGPIAFLGTAMLIAWGTTLL